MAATRLIALHKNKGMTVAACLKNRTDYIENPDKTEQGQFVSSYACSTLTADEEFMLTKRQYDLVNGRRQKSDVIAYQIRQSFRPGEITAEEANKVGYELAMRFTKGKYFRGVFADTVKDKLNVRAVQLHQLGFHQLGGVIVPGNADGLSGAAYGFHQQVHDLVQHIPVNPLGVLAKVFILDVVLDDLPINLYGAL